MTSPIRSREEPLYTPTEPEDLVCKDESAARSAAQSISAMSAAASAGEARASAGPDTPSSRASRSDLARDTDYLSLSIGVGEIIGGGIAITLDRYGHLYAGVGSGVSVSPTVGTASFHRGKLVESTAPEKSEEERLTKFLEGDAVEVTASLGSELSAVNSSGGTGIEIGVGLPQIGAQFQHNWHILDLPVRW
jgi:hypothetical protein